ncbi:hypothetical protein F8388_005647 [Cannabis sativa]|uniref:Uncharacterized protein n=1 Tax=Cannabis sativa TaxID=3483 RepID=A0A7J6GB36_CANSA|nr:hypothetical protein F8388_005647 [Cannabis sativa]KAF4380154.1 hypothetical protein G4B88_011228 [Cannabis sativa]
MLMTTFGRSNGLEETRSDGRDSSTPDMECCRSSSLGRNSDVSDESSNGEDSADDEAQNSFKGPLDTMDGLEEVLPIKYVSF